MLKSKALSFIGLAAVLQLFASAARADLLGSSVNISPYFPNTSTVFQPGPDTIVSGAIEYPTGTFTAYNSSWQIDITGSRIFISDTLGTGFPYATAPFNGWILRVLSGPTILSATADPASGFDPVDISIVNGNELQLNYSGVTGPRSGISIIDVVTVPEPQYLAIIGGLVVAIARAARNARRNRAD